MIQQTTPYGIGTTVQLSYADAVERTKAALADEGFGILAEMDIAATLRQKINVEFRPYVILGACNPPLAHRALLAEPDIGLLLPCNVIVYASDEPGASVVTAMDPVAALGLTGNAGIGPIAEDVRARMERVLRAIEKHSVGVAPNADS